MHVKHQKWVLDHASVGYIHSRIKDMATTSCDIRNLIELEHIDAKDVNGLQLSIGKIPNWC